MLFDSIVTATWHHSPQPGLFALNGYAFSVSVAPEYLNTTLVAEPETLRSMVNDLPLLSANETTEASPSPEKPASGFIQNMIVPPLKSSKNLRAGSSAHAFVPERYSPLLCEYSDSLALPSCEARTICGVSSSCGQRMAYTCGKVGIVRAFGMSSCWIVVFHQTSISGLPFALTA